jgi:hypothetical protein
MTKLDEKMPATSVHRDMTLPSVGDSSKMGSACGESSVLFPSSDLSNIPDQGRLPFDGVQGARNKRPFS